MCAIQIGLIFFCLTLLSCHVSGFSQISKLPRDEKNTCNQQDHDFDDFQVHGIGAL